LDEVADEDDDDDEDDGLCVGFSYRDGSYSGKPSSSGMLEKAEELGLAAADDEEEEEEEDEGCI
jgi:hypothetical protein